VKLGVSSANDHVQWTVIQDETTAVGHRHHRLKTTTSVAKSESIARHVMTTASRNTTIDTATRRPAVVIVHELHPQIRSIGVAVATRTRIRISTVRRAPTATEARSIVVATGLDLRVLMKSTRTMMYMSMEKRTRMAAALDESTGVVKRTGTVSENANDHAIRSVSGTAKTAKTATATTTTIARRIVPVIRTRTESGVAIVKLKTRSATTMTTSTVRHAVAAKTETVSEIAMTTASLVKRSPPIPTKKKTSSAK
jgi:hypothetical protein